MKQNEVEDLIQALRLTEGTINVSFLNLDASIEKVARTIEFSMVLATFLYIQI